MSKILIVEDSVIVSMHLKIFLEGYQHLIVDRLTTGEEVESVVREKKPDVILMDVMLAGNMNGIDAAKQSRKISAAPIIFMSALTDQTSVNDIKNIPNSYKMDKPFNETELIKLIDESAQLHASTN